MPDNGTGSRAPAVLFDVDGTPVDSNYLHIHAWQRAFAEVGVDVETWRIHRSIGMDGSTLVQSLSDDAPDKTAERLALWDAEASARAHVTSIGVLSGGVSRDELVNAGAVMVFENADDLVKHIEETPIMRLATIGS